MSGCGLATLDWSILALLVGSLVVLAMGGIIYFSNLKRDVPDLDSATRLGWRLILLAGAFMGIAIATSFITRLLQL